MYGAFVAFAASPSVHWSAPAGCPDPAAVEVNIDRTLTQNRSDVVEVEAQTSAGDDGWALSVIVTRPSGTFRRELSVDSCEAAAEAAPLVVGLLVSESQDPSEPEPETTQPPVDTQPLEPAPTAAPATPPKPEPKPEPEPEQPPVRRDWSAHLGASGGYSIGGLGPGGELVARAMLGSSRLRFGIRLGHEIRRQVRLTNPANTGANLSSFSAGPAGSWLWTFDRLTWLLSAAVPVGGVRARGIGGTSRQTLWVPWPTVVAGTGVQWALTRRLALRADIEGRLAFLRHDFVFDGRALRRTGPLSGAILVGPVVRVWP